MVLRFSERRTFFCTGFISGKLCRFYLCFRLALLHSVPYFFFLYRSTSSALCMVFDSISSNIDEVLLMNPTAISIYNFDSLREPFATNTSLSELYFKFRRFIMLVQTIKVISLSFGSSTSSSKPWR